MEALLSQKSDTCKLMSGLELTCQFITGLTNKICKPILGQDNLPYMKKWLANSIVRFILALIALILMLLGKGVLTNIPTNSLGNICQNQRNLTK